MTKQTLNKRELEKRIAELESKIEKLSIDPAYGIMTRAALDLEIALLSGARSIVYLDIDYLHKLNSEIGHAASDEKIRRALQIRSSDILLKARWYSGDEIIIILSGDPEAFIHRLEEAFALEGMTATFGFADFSSDYAEAVKIAKSQVDQSKAARDIKDR